MTSPIVKDIFGTPVKVGDRILKMQRRRSGAPFPEKTWHLVAEVGYCPNLQHIYMRANKIHGFWRGGIAQKPTDLKISRRTTRHVKIEGTLFIDHVWRDNHVR
jgi:hypothetical protein